MGFIKFAIRSIVTIVLLMAIINFNQNYLGYKHI